LPNKSKNNLFSVNCILLLKARNVNFLCSFISLLESYKSLFL
jgi:hypothetical protein